MNLKAAFFALALSCLYFIPVASADTNSAADEGGPEAQTIGRGRRGGKQAATNNARDLNLIRGDCSIVASPSNSIPGPCVALLLILNDSNGNEVFRTRTTSKGHFEFTGEQTKSYKLVSGSKSYDVVSPTSFIQSGDQVNLQLQQK